MIKHYIYGIITAVAIFTALVYLEFNFEHRRPLILYRDIVVKDSFPAGFDDIRLHQHVTAYKYKDSALTAKNVKSFLIEARVQNKEEVFGVALKETAYTNPKSTARFNNFFGFKIPRSRFTWAEKRATQNNAVFQHWTFGLLEYDEYKRAGGKRWSDYDKGAFNAIQSFE